MTPKIIIILGNSGSGKGTQAKFLQKKFFLDYVGSGDIVRARQNINDFTGRKLRETVNRGNYAPTAIIFKLWVDRWEGIKNKPDFRGFIVDGSPRKILEAELIDQTLEWFEWGKYLQVILADVSRDECFNRLTHRKICGNCKRHIPYIDEFKDLETCDKCNGKLITRADDTPEAINSRLDLFEKEVGLVIEYYEKSNRLVRINGEQSIEDVHKDILKALQ